MTDARGPAAVITPARRRLHAWLERTAGSYRPARELRFAQVAEALGPQAGGTPPSMLDVGCGEGVLAVRMAQRFPALQIEGLDPDPEATRLAEERAQRAGTSNARFTCRLLGPEDEGRYDAVLAIECLTEIPDDQAALDSIAGAVRPGGLLVLHVPERSWRPVLRSSPTTWRQELRHGYTSAELEAMVQARGLIGCTVLPTTYALVYLAQELRDRLRHATLKRRMLAYPILRAAVLLERKGLRLGAPRALLLQARRP